MDDLSDMDLNERDGDLNWLGYSQAKLRESPYSHK